MPSELIALVVATLATGWFVFATDASRGFKAIVSIALAGSLALRFLFPQWELMGVLLQILLVIGVIFYARIHA